MKLQIDYNSFFNRHTFSFVNEKIVQKCNRILFKTSGIYAIVNKVTGDRYIGKSKNITQRLCTHRSLLRNNRHTYKNGSLTILQKAWNKYGTEAFDFKIVELCDPLLLDEREKYWISFYKCNHEKYRKGYNTTDGGEGATANQNVKGRIQINNGKIQKMIYPNEFEEYKNQGFTKGVLPQNAVKAQQNRSKTSGGNHWAYGKKFTEEHRRKMSESRKGRQSWIKGKHWDQAHKDLFSRLSKGRKPSDEAIRRSNKKTRKPVIQYDKKGNKISEYISAIEAEKQTGIGRSHISQCCKGKRKTTGGFVWRYKNEQLENL